MIFKKLKDEVVFFFYPCQRRLTVLTKEYETALSKLGDQIDHAKSTVISRKVASQQQKN